jgi:hypothetical protein
LAKSLRLAVVHEAAPDWRCVSWGTQRGGKVETHDPGVLEGDHVVNIDVAGLCPCCAVIGREPCSGSGGAGTVGLDVGAVTLKDELAGTI